MSSPQPPEPLSAKMRFEQAFERLKAGQPKVLERGSAVTQNNVAREAGCDPSALKKARFPALIREIQAYLELHKPEDQPAARKAAQQKAAKRTLEERLADAVRQRDMAQSQLLSANRRVMELAEEVQSLQRRLDSLQPPPTKLGRR
jgi:chromosome segregation ATPase